MLPLKSTFLAAWLAWLAAVLFFLWLDLARAPDASYLRALTGVERPQNIWRRLAARLGPAIAAWFPAANLDGLEQKLIWGGSPLGLKAEGFIGLKALMAAAGLAAGGFLAALGIPSVFMPLLAALAYFAPDYWLSGLVERRRKDIAKALPDTVAFLVTALRAGVELAPALERVGRKLPGPLGDELRLAWREIATGHPRAAALRAMASRTGVATVERFVQTVITAEERGGMNLSDALSTFMNDLRESQRRKAEEEARKIPTKMLAPMMLCIFLPMLAMLLTPIVFVLQGVF